MRGKSKAQTVYRVRKQPSTFATIHKGFLADPRLSFACKGLLTYLLSKPDDWQTMSCDLMRVSGDGRDAIRKMQRQLSDAGYLRRCEVRDRKSGRFSRYEILVFETPELAAVAKEREQGTLFERFDPIRTYAPRVSHPHFQADLPVTGNPATEYPATEKPATGNPPLLRMRGTKNDGTNCDEGDAVNVSQSFQPRRQSAAERVKEMLRKESGL